MIRWLLTCLLLTGCGSWQLAGTDRRGNDYALQSTGLLNKAKGVVQKVKNGKIEMEQIVEEPDNVEGARVISDGVVSVKGLKYWFKGKQSDNTKDVQINQSNNDLEGLKSTNETGLARDTFVPPTTTGPQ